MTKFQAPRAINTRAYGYRFRSRLEARWAVALTEAGIRWEYEPQGFNLESGPYLPDFWLPDLKVWVEVKPANQSESERDQGLRRLGELIRETRCGGVLLSGIPGDVHEHWTVLTERNLGAEPDSVASLVYGELEDWDRREIDLCRERAFAENWACIFTPTSALFPESSIIAAREARFEHGETPGNAASQSAPKGPPEWTGKTRLQVYVADLSIRDPDALFNQAKPLMVVKDIGEFRDVAFRMLEAHTEGVAFIFLGEARLYAGTWYLADVSAQATISLTDPPGGVTLSYSEPVAHVLA